MSVQLHPCRHMSFHHCIPPSAFKLLKFRIESLVHNSLTLFHMGFFEPSGMGGGGGGGGSRRFPYLSFVVIAPMIMKFDTSIKLDVFYTMVTKKFVISLLLRNYEVITRILADAYA